MGPCTPAALHSTHRPSSTGHARMPGAAVHSCRLPYATTTQCPQALSNDFTLYGSVSGTSSSPKPLTPKSSRSHSLTLDPNDVFPFFLAPAFPFLMMCSFRACAAFFATCLACKTFLLVMFFVLTFFFFRSFFALFA